MKYVPVLQLRSTVVAAMQLPTSALTPPKHLYWNFKKNEYTVMYTVTVRSITYYVISILSHTAQPCDSFSWFSLVKPNLEFKIFGVTCE